MSDDSSDAGDATDDLSASIEGVRTRTNALTVSANAFARAISSAFAQAASGGKQFDDVLKSLALRLSSLSLNAALQAASRFGCFRATTSMFGGTSSGITGGTGRGRCGRRASRSPAAA